MCAGGGVAATSQTPIHMEIRAHKCGPHNWPQRAVQSVLVSARRRGRFVCVCLCVCEAARHLPSAPFRARNGRAARDTSSSSNSSNSNMAPAPRPARNEDERCGMKGDRKTRKPLVEKKRRARINDSLQELRVLLADAEGQSKMENAEVLEMTVKRVENILQKRAKEADCVNREASERFAAGYIQCMHEVHMFVSSCPGIDAGVAADLLNHLLECMPLNEEERFQDLLSDLLLDPQGCRGPPLSPGGRSAFSPCPSTASGSGSDLELSSDLDETDGEQSHAAALYPKSMWRPW
ncbi:transcription cofactor HES-6 isoform X2 [Denticeps clupeoides]|uniref:transcription cofactor HES-6 isoform X2 n=1 Tax=Denticeps clupeoides TaxID=299321 RepID=UPI0010A5390A|nr:transcription cofactor HES-6 isoform X2 [Denticeps clupeoides]